MPVFHTDRSRVRRGASQGPFLLALIGFVLALVTALYVVYRDPPWGRLSKYDFSTPEAAFKSQLRMMMNADLQAQSEYQAKFLKKFLKEKADTLEVRETADFEKKKVLFIAFKKDGKEVKTVQWFEKDEDSGLWKQAFETSVKVRETNKKLADKIDAWPTSDEGHFGGVGPFDN